MSIELQWGLPKDQYHRAARIIYDAFEHKFRYILGPRDKAIDFITSQFNDKFALVALQEGKIIGIAGARTTEGELIDIKLIPWLRTYHIRTLRGLLIALPLLFERKQPGVLELSTLSVTDEARGKGVGSLIINEFIRHGQSKGFHMILLEVIDENIRAKALYERLGFETVKHENVPQPWSFLLGFSGASQMVYQLR